MSIIIGKCTVSIDFPLGNGTFGAVYKAKNNETQEILAAKQLILADDEGQNPYRLEMAKKELDIMHKLHNHKHIVTVHKDYFDQKACWLIMEYCDCNLDVYLKRKRMFSKSKFMSTQCGTEYFMAPEFFDGTNNPIKYDASVDVFALGLVCLVVVENKEGGNRMPLSGISDIFLFAKRI